ncbi:uncharacterized protein TNCV_4983191 [Trichonephila clavipes]|uniref:Reverse transcriptase domain-containing protein n=1 Tax=Trichonephila clavipes TaxID=2585209 RepID=A0A8X6WH91_TRICX|nr:uncharacterized protein TNCV_4983191 [Trichonephila clavipes]
MRHLISDVSKLTEKTCRDEEGEGDLYGFPNITSPTFADDILVCSQGRDLSETFLHAQEALSFASDWSKSFKLEFNPDKTRFMAIEKRNVCYDAFQLYLDGTPLTMVKQMKYLGVLLDTKFSWKQHQVTYPRNATNYSVD